MVPVGSQTRRAARLRRPDLCPFPGYGNGLRGRSNRRETVQLQLENLCGIRPSHSNPTNLL